MRYSLRTLVLATVAMPPAVGTMAWIAREPQKARDLFQHGMIYATTLFAYLAFAAAIVAFVYLVVFVVLLDFTKR